MKRIKEQLRQPTIALEPWQQQQQQLIRTRVLLQRQCTHRRAGMYQAMTGSSTKLHQHSSGWLSLQPPFHHRRGNASQDRVLQPARANRFHPWKPGNRPRWPRRMTRAFSRHRDRVLLHGTRQYLSRLHQLRQESWSQSRICRRFVETRGAPPSHPRNSRSNP